VLRLFIALNGIQGPGEKLQKLGSALRAPLRNLGLVTGYAAQRVLSVVGATDKVDVEVHESLREHVSYFEKHVADLARATEASVMRHRKAIVERQFVLERLADMAIELYATACTIARTQRLIEQQGVEGSARELALCDLFCVESGRRFRRNRVALGDREERLDDQRRAVAAAAREAKGYWVRDAILTEETQPVAPSAVLPEADTSGVASSQVGRN